MPESVFKVLIVDDDISLSMLLSNTLRNAGLEAHTANNGKDGVEKARDIQPDTILMDINMPKMNGFEACELIKKDPETSAIPVIFMTSMANDNDRIKGFSCGADDYVIKPINHKELLSRLKRFIDTRDSKALSQSLKESIDKCCQLLAKLVEIDLPSNAKDIAAEISNEFKKIMDIS